MAEHRTIIVKGNYIARQDIGVQILHADHVYTNSSDATKAPRVAEDVPYEEVSAHFCYITEMCKKNAMVEHVEAHLRVACRGTAEALWDTIHEFEHMQYLATQDVDAAKIYSALTTYFGPLPFTERNFRKYRF